MHKKMYKRNPARDDPDELVELYKNKSFQAKSLSATRVSSVKFSADGQMSTKCEKCQQIGDRHVTANLELPALKERCATGADEKLYKLSKQLAEGVVELPADDANQASLNESHQTGHKSGMTWENYSKLYDEEGKLRETCFTNEYSAVAVTIAAKIQPQELQVQHKSEEQAKKKLKHKKTTASNKSHSTDSAGDTRSDSVHDNAPKKVTPTRKFELATEEQRAAMLDLAKCEAEQEIKKLSQQVNPIPSPIVKSFNVLRRMLQFACDFIDDYYGFTILLPLGIGIFLVYILFVDVSLYVNEEQRYLRKMRSSGVLLKWFYYVMHLLKVRIF
ncbi:hypothetical protein KR093_003080 [Drosophila rubida]|uniref:Uncharacterized protein n=1 Tax=Drosophila rubida TaxID=30044 RepID=A0AAD4PKC3_9MUSC|nr:hypothetical protein KR093_003080 [Drosophila rubida]